MKRFKNLFILLGVLVALCVVTLIVTHVEEKKEQIKNADETILAIASDSVTGLSWQYGETSLSFRKDGKWLWDEDENFPVNEEKINNLLAVFEDFGAAFIIEEVDDLGQYGLNSPTCTIKVDTDSSSYEIKLGSFSSLDSQRYVSIGDGNVYLVKADPYDAYEISISDLILNDEVPTMDGVSKLVFKGTENYTISYEEGSSATYNESDVYFTEQKGEKVPLDTSLVENYCSNVGLISLNNYVTYNATDSELAMYGLDNPDLTMSIDYTLKDKNDNESHVNFQMSVGQNQEELVASQEAQAAGEEYDGTVSTYARIGDSKIIYKITTADYDTILACGYNQLRHKEVLSTDFAKVTSVDIVLEGESYSFTTTVDEEENLLYLYNGEEVDFASIKSAITSLSATGFSDEKPSKKEEISMTVHLEDETYSDVIINIYRYDGTSCLVTVNDKTMGFVTRSSLVDLMEAVYSIVLG